MENKNEPNVKSVKWQPVKKTEDEYHSYIDNLLSTLNSVKKISDDNTNFTDVPNSNKDMSYTHKRTMIERVKNLEKEDQWRIYCMIADSKGEKVFNVKQRETCIVLNNLDNQLLWKIDWFINQSIKSRKKLETQTQYYSTHQNALNCALKEIK